MVCGSLALLALPAAVLVVVLRLASRELGAGSAVGALALLVIGVLCGLTCWRLRPRPGDLDPPPDS